MLDLWIHTQLKLDGVVSKCLRCGDTPYLNAYVKAFETHIHLAGVTTVDLVSTSSQYERWYIPYKKCINSFGKTDKRQQKEELCLVTVIDGCVWSSNIINLINYCEFRGINLPHSVNYTCQRLLLWPQLNPILLILFWINISAVLQLEISYKMYEIPHPEN